MKISLSHLAIATISIGLFSELNAQTQLNPLLYPSIGIVNDSECAFEGHFSGICKALPSGPSNSATLSIDTPLGCHRLFTTWGEILFEGMTTRSAHMNVGTYTSTITAHKISESAFSVRESARVKAFTDGRLFDEEREYKYSIAGENLRVLWTVTQTSRDKNGKVLDIINSDNECNFSKQSH